ncbi:hypothetical protein Zm00014a_008382 [Zea mays]|uniref:Uncharacterized protein n=1 Tax=Zea mays TaxID=4577 RepID=A0A317YDQ8_MAIZE|nr:hypothetical protein Zm00014a_008382 [Zea mays]
MYINTYNTYGLGWILEYPNKT